MSEEQQENRPGSESKQKRAVRAIAHRDVGTHQSYWPLALALAILILLFAIMSESIVLGVIGVLLTVAAVMGWGLEKR